MNNKKVKFDDSVKTFDGSSPKYIEMYKIIASYFNDEPKYFRIGKTNDDIDKLRYIYENNTVSSLYSSFSKFLKHEITSRKSYKENLLPNIKLKTYKDCIIIANNNVDTIIRCIFNLKQSKKSVNNKYKEKSEDEKLRYLDNKYEFDEIWDKKCSRYYCYDSDCCLTKKTLLRKNYKLSLIRSGSRDYSLSIDIDYVNHIDKLIEILQDALFMLNKENLRRELKNFLI